jgi:hypothetical protein
MKLVYPQNKLLWNPKKLQGIPDRLGNDTGHRLIGIGQSGFDLYVAFTNDLSTEVWIEKTTTLHPLSRTMCMEMLSRITDEKEFVRAHQFFIKEGLLEGPQQKA